MKGIYLASYKAYHPGYNIIYQDINGKRDIGGDMLNIDISQYDYIIATPPCNYYSRANYRRNSSYYALNTMHLLPDILNKLTKQNKPFIVENVINKPLMKKLNLFNYPCFIYFVGRHTYWTNVFVNLDCEQIHDNIQAGNTLTRQGGTNVHNVIETFLRFIHN